MEARVLERLMKVARQGHLTDVGGWLLGQCADGRWCYVQFPCELDPLVGAWIVVRGRPQPSWTDHLRRFCQRMRGHSYRRSVPAHLCHDPAPAPNPWWRHRVEPATLGPEPPPGSAFADPPLPGSRISVAGVVAWRTDTASGQTVYYVDAHGGGRLRIRAGGSIRWSIGDPVRVSGSVRGHVASSRSGEIADVLLFSHKKLAATRTAR